MPSRPTRISKRRSNKKWSPVLTHAGVTQDIASRATSFTTGDLCINSSNITTAPTATVIKAGNFKVVADVNVSNPFNGSGRMYVMYLPQGYTPTIDTPEQHPEWILCWRGFEPGLSGLQSISMQSKLKRNLNSGDRISLFCSTVNLSTSESNLSLSITVSYVCCAN